MISRQIPSHKEYCGQIYVCMCVREKTIIKAMSTGTAHNNIDKEDNDNDGSIENNNE